MAEPGEDEDQPYEPGPDDRYITPAGEVPDVVLDRIVQVLRSPVPTVFGHPGPPRQRRGR